MQPNLLSSLRKYRPREGHDPLENFMTQAFAWLLNNHTDFSDFFIKTVLQKLTLEQRVYLTNWQTQVNFDGVYPDMLCELDEFVLIFEHKVGSPLHHNQLQNYRDYAQKNYANHYLILITASTYQHTQNPDLALCWADIYQLIDSWLMQQKPNNNFIFKDFLNLLADVGLAPAAPISHESILAYYTGIELPRQLNSLINRVIKEPYWINKNIDVKLTITSDKIMGASLLGLTLDSSQPNILIGFLLDSYDYGTQPILGNKSPDFCIIISFDKSLHNDYPSNKNYIAFVSHVSAQVNALDNGFEFYHHIEDAQAISNNSINKWHPIHIRKPILELFRASLTAEQQTEQFMYHVKQILDLVFNCPHFHLLKQDYNRAHDN